MAPRKFEELYKAGKVACPFPYLRDEDGASPRMISCVDLEHSLCCTLIWDSNPRRAESRACSAALTVVRTPYRRRLFALPAHSRRR